MILVWNVQYERECREPKPDKSKCDRKQSRLKWNRMSKPIKVLTNFWNDVHIILHRSRLNNSHAETTWLNSHLCWTEWAISHTQFHSFLTIVSTILTRVWKRCDLWVDQTIAIIQNSVRNELHTILDTSLLLPATWTHWIRFIERLTVWCCCQSTIYLQLLCKSIERNIVFVKSDFPLNCSTQTTCIPLICGSFQLNNVYIPNRWAPNFHFFSFLKTNQFICIVIEILSYYKYSCMHKFRIMHWSIIILLIFMNYYRFVTSRCVCVFFS